MGPAHGKECAVFRLENRIIVVGLLLIVVVVVVFGFRVHEGDFEPDADRLGAGREIDCQHLGGGVLGADVVGRVVC